MKLTLPDALHARPANLLVRLAAQHGVAVELRKGSCRADAGKILDVLALGAAKGDEIEIFARGEGAEGAMRAIAELVARNFDGDLVPEVGSGAVEGIAIGRALVVTAEGIAEARGGRDSGARGSPEEERARLVEAERRAFDALDALLATLAPEERALFEPERAILAEVVASAHERVAAGDACEDAIAALTAVVATDLILDARARLLEALTEDGALGKILARATGLGDEVIAIVEALTPSLVAQLPPQVGGIVAVDDEPDAGRVRTSHAAILARGRELPLALVPAHVAMAIGPGDVVVLDTTSAPARVWVAPSASFLAGARERKARQHGEDAAEVARSIAAVAEGLGVALLVNVGSVHDRVPMGAAGIGLLRTELLFAGKTSAPSERDQLGALLAVARRARGAMVTVRLWDAGGDKPLAWLGGSSSDARGAALLFEHPAILDAQLAAIARAAERAAMRVLIPMTRSARDVEHVRARVPKVAVGAMIETPEAAADAASIAAAADFVCIGTNDLSALLLGVPRSDASQALDRRVLALVEDIVSAAHAFGKRVTVCGEVAADPRGAPILVGLGVDALSVAPPRVRDAAAALGGWTRDRCKTAAGAAKKEGP